MALQTTGNYPDPVAKIIQTKCATAGCHDEVSKEAAAGLSLATWAEAFEGSNNGNPAIIPYAVEPSSLFLFTNTFEDLGSSNTPVMPVNGDPLSREEIETLIDWINAGAPNADGHVMWSDDPEREKYYVLNLLCNQVAVFDRDSRKLMRYIDVPIQAGEFNSELVTADPTGEYWYVLLRSGRVIKYNASNDQIVSDVDLGVGTWIELAISDNGEKAVATSYRGNSDYYGGSLTVVDLPTMTIDHVIDAPQDSVYFPFGAAWTPSGDAFYACAYLGNFIYKVDMTGAPVVERIKIQEGEAWEWNQFTYKPGMIEFMPGGNEYALLAEKPYEVRFYNAANDSLTGIVQVAKYPIAMSASATYPYLFVSCMEDQTTFSGKSRVDVIDRNTHSLVTSIYAGYQSRGLVVDDEAGLVYVANRNADPTGADVPHHYTSCDGNNGYVTIIDMSTLSLVPDYKVEVSVEPWAITLRK